MFSKDEIIRAGYRVLLEREPENTSVVEEAAASMESAEEILKHFSTSTEYIEKLGAPGYLSAVAVGRGARRQSIETHTSLDNMQALFERVRKQWSKLGETEPYWSVLTDERYRMSTIERHQDSFEASARNEMALFDAALDRCFTNPPKGVCLELGCGVGRATRYLSTRFDSIVAVDVAEGNMRICKEAMQQDEIENVDCRLLTKVQDIADLPEFDMLYSVMVLQHNPPPVILYMLGTLLPKLRPGGVAYFQVPTHTLRYAFSIEKYFNSDPSILDMHALPMQDVFSSIATAGLELREVLADGWTGQYGSHTFIARKPA
ncbi:MAG: hypothetical protein APF80_16695 [Alphaproteobacteria bacterium BRH_c36]|nr:MAG: hypothetical protein APF80_16695 [Alphaproteobacteria bacterium BRH_c36]